MKRRTEIEIIRDKIIIAIPVIQITMFFLCMNKIDTYPTFLQVLFHINTLSLIFTSCFACIAAKRCIKKTNKKTFVDEEDKTIHDYDETIREYFPNMKGEKELLDELFHRFEQIEEATGEGKKEILEKLCVDSLYQSLYHQYRENYKKGEKHILEDYRIHSYNIQNISLENHMIAIQVFFHVSFLDYFTDLENHYLRGDQVHYKHAQYSLDFVIDQENNMICPNCGSHVSSQTCEYCKTKFKDVYYDFSLAKIGLIKNKNE